MWPAFEQFLARYQELEGQMADPAIIADRPRYTQAAKEHGSLAKKVKPYQEYMKLSEEIAEAETMASGGDPEMKELADEELGGLRSRHQALRSKLEDFLLVDPGEDFNSIIVEIRGGTG